jgi:hypothetical protein
MARAASPAAKVPPVARASFALHQIMDVHSLLLFPGRQTGLNELQDVIAMVDSELERKRLFELAQNHEGFLSAGQIVKEALNFSQRLHMVFRDVRNRGNSSVEIPLLPRVLRLFQSQ